MVIIAAMGDCVDADMEADENNTCQRPLVRDGVQAFAPHVGVEKFFDCIQSCYNNQIKGKGFVESDLQSFSEVP